MSNQLPKPFKQIVYNDIVEAVELLRVQIELGGDDEAYVEGLIHLLMKLQACGRRAQGHSPELLAIWKKVAQRKGYVGSNEETRPMERDAVQGGFMGDQIAEEAEAASKPDTGLMKTLKMLGKPKEAEEPEEPSDPILEEIEAITTGRHQRPQAS